MNNKISIIIPEYNEEEAIGKVLDDCLRVMREKGYDFEVIVVDDASQDRSAEIAKSKGVKVIRHLNNRGVGAARKTGMLNASGDTIVMLDSDGTYPAESIPELLNFIPEYDQVIGCRRTETGSLKLLRQPVKLLMFGLASFLVKHKIPDLNSGFRALKKEIVLQYLHLVPNGFSCVSTMTLVFLCNGYNVKYIPIDYFKRIGKSKFRIFVDTRDFLFTILRIIMYFNPLRIFASLSLALLIFALIKMAWEALLFKTAVITAVNAALLIASAVIFIFGLLADLIVTQAKRQGPIS